MGLVRQINRLQRALTGLFLLFATSFLFFNTTRILQDRKSGYVQDDFWSQSSILYNTKYQAKAWNLNEFMFGNSGRSRAAYNQFLSIQSQYESQKNFGLVNAYTEQMYYLEMSAMSQNTLQLIQQNQAENIREALGKSAAKEYLTDPNYSFLKSPATVVGALAAFYTGRVIRFSLNDEWRMSLQNAGGSNAKIALLGVSRDGFSGSAARDENNQYRLLVNQRLVGNTSASTAYSASTQSAAVGFSHALSEGWTVHFDHSITGVEKNQDSVHLNYSKGF